MNTYHQDQTQENGERMKCIKIAVFLTMYTALTASVVFSAIYKQINFISTEGTIVDRRSCGDDDLFAAIIEYYDEYNQQTYQFQSSNCYNPGPTVGNPIKVLYNPENPGISAVDASFLGLWLTPLILSIIDAGILFVVIRKACGNDKSHNTFEEQNHTNSYTTQLIPIHPQPTVLGVDNDGNTYNQISSSSTPYNASNTYNYSDQDATIQSTNQPISNSTTSTFEYSGVTAMSQPSNNSTAPISYFDEMNSKI